VKFLDTLKETLKNLWIIFFGLILGVVLVDMAEAGILKIEAKADEADFEEQYVIAAEELAGWFEPSRFEKHEVPDEEPSPDLGVYLNDINFRDAFELNYNYLYGVRVGQARSGMPADSLVLWEDDVILEVDGQKARSVSQLDKLVESKHIGDEIRVKYFRDGATFENSLMIVPRSPMHFERHRERVRLSGKRPLGLGGLTYKPIYVAGDYEPINALIESLGFNGMANDGMIYHGIDGHGLIGNGFFLGGMGGWAGLSRQGVYTLPAEDVNVFRDLKYRTSIWGVTFDKRYRPADRLILSAGFQIGGGKNRIEMYQIDENIDWDQLESVSTDTYNDYLELKKKYFLLQPRVAVMYRVLPVFWIKLEAGYMTSYSRNGWRTIVEDNKYEITGPADGASLSGFTISISPWFGF